MVLDPTQQTNYAAANSLLSPQERIYSKYDINVTLGAADAAAVLGVGYPLGYNKSTEQHAAWMAPDPTVAVITLTGATGGSFTITVNGKISAAIAYDATAATLVAELRAIGYDVSASLNALIYTVTFDGQTEIEILPTVTVDTTNITGDVAESVVVTDGTAQVQDPTLLNIDLEDRTGGTFTITYAGNTTAAIAYDATDVEIETAILAIAVSPPVSVSVTRQTGGHEVAVAFDDLADLLSLPTVSATLTSLTGGAGATAVVTVGNVIVPDETTVAIDVGTATGGMFDVTVDGETTAGIAFDASAANVDSALLAIGYTVTTALVGTTYTITFDDKDQVITLPTATASIAGLTGATAGVVTAGAATNGTDEIRGFINPNDTTIGTKTGDITLSRVTTTATATTVNPHGLVTGMSLTISGATNTAYNITATITVTGTRTFTYAIADSGISVDSGAYTTTNDIMVMMMSQGIIHAALPQSLVAASDVTALNTAMKNGLVEKGLIVQGLAARF